MPETARVPRPKRAETEAEKRIKTQLLVLRRIQRALATLPFEDRATVLELLARDTDT